MPTSPPEVQAAPLLSQGPNPAQQQLVGNKGASRIHILGASGSGVSTLGTKLASALSIPVFDVDDYYWLPTNPPYTTKRPIPERISLLIPILRHAQEESGGWVLSGSMGAWGVEIMEDVEYVLFVDTATDVRMKRLREREFRNHGERIHEGGDMHEESVKFLAWAEAYEDPDLEEGRSRAKHEQWLREVKVPFTRLWGDQEESVVLKAALKALKRDGQ
jgi:adenylate kinase family enzyme